MLLLSLTTYEKSASISKDYKLGGLEQQKFFLSVQDARSLKSGCQQSLQRL